MGRKPRAMPWAGMSRPFRAGRSCPTSNSLRSIFFRLQDRKNMDQFNNPE